MLSIYRGEKVAVSGHTGFKALQLVPRGTPVGRFALVCCFECYRFIGNVDARAQADNIAWFMEQVSETGQPILHQMWRNPRSPSFDYEDLTSLLAQFGFELVSIPHPKLLAPIPSVFASPVAAVSGVRTGKELTRKVVFKSRKQPKPVAAV